MAKKSVRQINPWVSDDGSSFGFHTGDMNYYGESLTCTNSEVYQRVYMPYSFMKINKKGRHVLNWLVRNPWLWQKENYCKFTPMGKIGQDRTSVIPCEGKVNLQICTKDFLNSCFDKLVTWKESGEIDMDDGLRRILMDVYRQYALGINEGARIVGLLGGILEEKQIDELFESKDEGALVPFKSTLGICNGVFAEARIAAAKGASHLNNKTIFQGMEIDEETGLLTEASILKAWERTLTIARKQKGGLKKLANKKKIKVTKNGKSVTLHAMWHVSPLLWESVQHVVDTRCETLLNPQCRMKEVTVGTGDDAETGYMIDKIILIPTEEVTELEECINGRFLFAYFTFGGNFQLGGSFVDSQGRNNLGVRITDEGAILGSKEGIITIVSHAVFSGTILNKNMAVGAQTIVPV